MPHSILDVPRPVGMHAQTLILIPYFYFYFGFLIDICRWKKIEGGDIVRTPMLKFRKPLRIKISEKHIQLSMH